MRLIPCIMMKLYRVFSLVLLLHIGVIFALMTQPGCQTPQASQPTPADTLATNEPADPAPAESRASSSVDPAFNAGVTGSSTRSAAPSRAAPRRPEGVSSAGPSYAEPDDTLLEPVAVVDRDPAYETYTVQRGDSLWAISRDFDVSLDALLEANDLTKESVIQIGQELRIPASTTSPDAPGPTDVVYESGAEPSVDTTVYVVQRGDTLSGIARKAGLSVSALKAANGLTNDMIRVGQKLEIPAGGNVLQQMAESGSGASGSRETPVPGEGEALHTVKPGENPTIIANKYGMSVRALLEMNNNFDPRLLKAGQQLLVREPDGSTGKNAGPEAGSSRASSSGSTSDADEEQAIRPVPVRPSGPGPVATEAGATSPTRPAGSESSSDDDFDDIPVVRVIDGDDPDN
ncbi:MAG: LysM peptidoglycan-binding domain-containing protein [Opitutales bacterium]